MFFDFWIFEFFGYILGHESLILGRFLENTDFLTKMTPKTPQKQKNSKIKKHTFFVLLRASFVWNFRKNDASGKKPYGFEAIFWTSLNLHMGFL